MTTTIRQMTIMALRYLSGRKLRTVLTTLAIVFGVALIFAINITLPGAIATFTRSLSSLTGADLTITNVTGASFTPEDTLAIVEGVDGVRAASGVLRRAFTLPSVGNELGNATSVEMIGIDPATIQSVRQITISEGRFLEADDTNAVVMPAGIAEIAPQIGVGTTFPLISAAGLRLYNVVGLSAEQGNLSVPPLYMTLADVQAAFGQPGQINTIEIALDPSADRAAVGSAVIAALGDNFVVEGATSGGEAFAAVQASLLVLNLMGVLALFLGAFLIFNTFRTIVIERRRDLGMLRAIGATRRQITTMIVIESLLQGVIGTLIGLLLGYLMAQGVIAGMRAIYTNYFSGVSLNIQVDAGSILSAVVLGLLTALIAGYLPARSAGRISPLEALRPSPTAMVNNVHRRSLIVGVVLMVLALAMLFAGGQTAVGGAIVFLVGLVVAAPGLIIPVARLFSPLLTLWFAREGDLARGNLQRQPGRAAITASTLMIGLAVLILMAALVLSLGVLVNTLADRNFASDVFITPPSIGVYSNVLGADASLEDRLRDLPEVSAVGSLRYAASTINGTRLEVLGIDPQTYPEVADLEFSAGTSDEAFSELGEGRTAIVSGLAASTLNLQMNSDFTLQTANGPQTYHIVGIGQDILTFKLATIFISQDNMAADFNKTEDVLLMLNFQPGVEQEAGLASVNTVMADYPQFTAHLTGQYRQTLVETTNAAFVILYGLAGLILIPAVLGLLNTLTINTLERTREIGIVRAVGGSQKQARRMVTAEALLLGIFGSALGVIAGVVMSYGFVGAFATFGWEVPFIFPVAGVIAAIIVGVLLALFAGILPARTAARLDIIRALQYE
jgi:putative ABC transport system permease protein